MKRKIEILQIITNEKIKYFLLSGFLFFLSLTSFAEQKILIEKFTPFFSTPDIKSRVIFVTNRNIELDYLDSISDVLNEYPLIRKVSFYKVLNADGSNYSWVSPEAKIDFVNGRSVLSFRQNIDYKFYFAQNILILLLVICLLIFGYYVLVKKAENFNKSTKVSLILISILVLFRLIIVSYILSRMNNLYTFPADEISYANIAKDIYNLNFSVISSWSYTIGYSLFLLPIMYLFGSCEYYSIIKEICIYNCYFLSSLNLCLIFLILKKLSGSNKKAFFSVFVLIFLSFILFSKEIWPIKFFNAVVLFPDVWNRNIYEQYNLLYNIGYIGLSHIASYFLLLLCVYISLIMKPKLANIIYISILFSLACLTRIDSFFIAPMIGFLFWSKFKFQITRNKFVLLKIIIISMISFGVIYTPQLIINYFSRGSLFASPYEMHAIAKKTLWSLDKLLNLGIDYQISICFIYIAIGITGLFFTKNRFNKIILIFWSFSFYFFYCGYCDVGNNPFRFVQLTFAGLTGSFCICEIWDNLKLKDGLLISLVFILNLICIKPRLQYLSLYLDTTKYYMMDFSSLYNFSFVLVLAIFMLVFLCLYFHKNKKAAFFVFIFQILFLIANSYLFFLIMICLYIYAFLIWFKDFFMSLYFKKPVGN